MVENSGTPKSAGAFLPINPPYSIQVRARKNGKPSMVWVRGRPFAIDEITDQWRIDDEWWTEQPISRMYYECILSNGRRIVVFFDLITIQWFQQIN